MISLEISTICLSEIKGDVKEIGDVDAIKDDVEGVKDDCRVLKKQLRGGKDALQTAEANQLSKCVKLFLFKMEF